MFLSKFRTTLRGCILMIFFVLVGQNLFSMTLSDGYLGFFLEGGFLYREADSSGGAVTKKLAHLPFGVVGSAENNEIYTEVLLFDNMIYAGDQYANRSDYVGVGMDHFSYVRFLVEYETYRASIFQVHIGMEPGHRGYIHSAFKRPVYQIYLAGVFSLRAQIGSYFLLRSTFTLPLTFLPLVYAHNLDRIREYRIQQEVIFNPDGQVMNPTLPSVYLSLGARYSNTFLKTYDFGTWNYDAAEVFFRFTNLY